MPTPAESYETYYNYYYTEHMPALAKTMVRLFEWQNHANEVLLWVVTVLSVSGVILAAYQLHWTMKKTGNVEQNSSISFDAKGATISSPFVGISILVISFSFFFMFVREVYSIQPLSLESDRSSSMAPTWSSTTAQQPAMDPY